MIVGTVFPTYILLKSAHVFQSECIIWIDMTHKMISLSERADRTLMEIPTSLQNDKTTPFWKITRGIIAILSCRSTYKSTKPS